MEKSLTRTTAVDEEEPELHQHHKEEHRHHSDCCDHDDRHDNDTPAGHHNEAHGHSHHHSHAESGCGHDHSHTEGHNHHDHDTCGCGHDHHHDHEEESRPLSGGKDLHIYIVSNLDCANCAAKMEAAINKLEGVEEATLTFSTKQLRVRARDADTLLPQIQAVCAAIESEVELVPQVGHARPVQEEEAGHPLLLIAAGAVLFVLGKILEIVLPAIAPLGVHPAALAIYIVGYLLLGGQVLLKAVKNIGHGQIFDENFLMSIATLGAFAIGDYPEALAVMLFYRIGEYFEDRAVARSRSNIMDALDLRPEVVNLIRGEAVSVIPAEDALPGDRLLIRPGDRIPLDGTVEEGESQLDTAAITGEPIPVAVAPGDQLISGCVNLTGVLHMRVEQPLAQSMVTRIMESVESAAAAKPQIERYITRFSRVYTPIVVALAILTAIVPSLITWDWIYWIKTALTFLVISCPCALVLSVPLAFFSGIGAASRANILFKGGSAMEALERVKLVVMDKTGTITAGTFQLERAEPAEGVSLAELLTAAGRCELSSTHPIALSVLAAARAQGLELDPPRVVTEHAGLGIEADDLLCGSAALLESRGVALPALESCPGAQVLVARQDVYLGRLVISDRIKEDSPAAIQSIRSMGLETAILTGDNAASAGAVAKEVGVRKVMSGLLPHQKVETMQRLRQEYGSVMFIGDGINDAPVLAGADVGCAMGSGADAALEAADVVFLTSRLSAVPKAISIARQAMSIARQNVIFALVVKIAVILVGYLGYANMWAAVFADTGVAMLCILNSMRVLYQNRKG